MRAIKKSGITTEFLPLLDSVDSLGRGPLCEIPGVGRYLAIRHDVDHDLEGAMKFARFESLNKIRSTYFLLHTEGYFGGPRFADQCRELSDLGHEIGLHYNGLPLWWEGRDPWPEIEGALDKIRSLGISVIGASSHGDSRCRMKGRANYEIFTVSKSNNPDTPRRRDLSELGLKYEAYFLPRIIYLCDSGGYWAHHRIAGDEFKALKDREIDPQSIVDDYNNGGDGTFQLLVHWDWWKLN